MSSIHKNNNTILHVVSYRTFEVEEHLHYGHLEMLVMGKRVNIGKPLWRRDGELYIPHEGVRVL